MDGPVAEVYVCPSQAQSLAKPQPREDQGGEQSTCVAAAFTGFAIETRRCIEQSTNLVRPFDKRAFGRGAENSAPSTARRVARITSYSTARSRIDASVAIVLLIEFAESLPALSCASR